MKKKITALILSFVMVFVLVPQTFALEDFILSDENMPDESEIPSNIGNYPGFIPDYFAENNIDTSDHSFTNAFSARTLNKFLTDYPHGSYYNTKKTSACACHGTVANNYTDGCWEGSGSTCSGGTSSPTNTCTAFGDGIQCSGYARRGHNMISGRTYANGLTYNYYQYLTEASAKGILQMLNTGTYIRVYTSTGWEHSVVLGATSNTHVTIYHANSGGACLIKHETMTFASFVNAFPYIYFSIY